ncbi:MAG: hypothetical protein ACYTCU_00915 [Planctomycetota bacterium]
MTNRTVSRGAASVLLGCGLALSACAAPVAPVAPAGPAFPLSSQAVDATTVPGVRATVERGRADVEAFFGERFAEPVRILLLPDRAAFTASFPAEWGMTQTQCWMVAAGVADTLHLLSPRAWAKEACEHDATDEAHVQGIVTHELAHCFHMQNNPTRDGTGMEPMGWFVEGLAVYVSGQLEEGHQLPARDAVEKGVAPTQLEDGWSGPYRYGVSGSLVRYIDLTWGREVLRELLAVTSEAELLDALGVTEERLLTDWRAFVLR